MLSLLCGSPDVVDSPFYDTHSRRTSRGTITRLGRARSDSSKSKKRILKGSIGAPTGFRHEGHMGSDNMMAPTGSWDLDQWKTELEKHMQVQPTVSPSTSAPTSTAVSPASSIITPRRKPVPSLLPPPREMSASAISSAASSPTRTGPIPESENEDRQAAVAL
ncbi:hypothetical protein RHS02_09291, partial [Rhizoctonia solani]